MSGIGRGHGNNRGVALVATKITASDGQTCLVCPPFCACRKFLNCCSVSGGCGNSLKIVQETWELAD